MGVNHFTRIDTLQIQLLLQKKLGQQKAESYFNLLNRHFDPKQSPVKNFTKFCILLIGKENRYLHNKLCLSILKNALLSKTPPPNSKNFTNSLNVKITRGQKTNLQSLVPLSPKKNRSPRKVKDRFTPLGQNLLHQSPTELHSLGGRPPLSVEDGEEVVSGSPGTQSRSPVTAPLGISLNARNAPVGISLNARKSLYRACGPANPSRAQTCQETFQLPDSQKLRDRLKQKLEVEGLNVSEDCANLINVGLDAYLKRLIEPCVGFARSKPGQRKSTLGQSQSQRVSLLDVSVAMEIEPRRFGGDWSTQMERLRISSFED